MSVGTRIKLMAHDLFFGKEQDVHCTFNALKVIGTAHERVIEGKAFHHAEVSSLSAGAIKSVLIVPQGINPHNTNYSFIADQGAIELNFYENPFTNVSSLGVEGSFHNLNRSKKAVAANIKIYDSPFIDANSLGLLIDADLIPQSSGGSIKSIDGQAGDGIGEWVLNNGDTYLVRITNRSSNTAFYRSSVSFYETEND